MSMRLLRDEEIPLVKALFDAAGIEFSKSMTVEDMNDGGMGSLLIKKDTKVGLFDVAKLEFIDEDNVVVFATLNCATNGEPVEIDMWKVDYSKLKKWPEADQLKL